MATHPSWAPVSKPSAFMVLMLLAVCAMLYRDSWLPLWARPEAYRLVGGHIQRVDRNETYLAGYPNLVFADSQGGSCPWAADVLYFPSADPEDIIGALDYYCGDWRYEQIVIWWGTGHFGRGASLDEYLRVLTAVVQSAQRRTDKIFIVGPVPYHFADGRSTAQAVAQAVQALRTRFPDIPVYDMNDFWRQIPDNGGAARLLLSDHLHISAAGYDVLGRELAAYGFLIPPRREHS